MKDRIFIDTNVFVYAYLEDSSNIKKRQKFIASALKNNCSFLYSEDMQHNQIIENSLRIINPF